LVATALLDCYYPRPVTPQDVPQDKHITFELPAPHVTPLKPA
jgi:hypothetical protein